MPEKVTLNGYDEFSNFVENIKVSNDTYILFSAKWCPDCVQAEPFITKAVDSLLEQSSVFAYVNVGDRTAWKESKNPFRTDKRTHLTVIPTMIKWNTMKRLEMGQCEKQEFLEMFFEADD